MPLQHSVDVTRATLLLVRAPELGGRRLRALVAACGGIAAAASAGVACWRRHHLGDATIAWLQRPDERRLDADFAWLEPPGRQLLIDGDPAWPERLGALADAPLALFLRGDADWLACPLLAVVGSRNATRGGVEVARDFAADLAERGLVIVSGLAVGIDAAAHRGALEVGGGTLAVCGTGLDRVYPAAHAELAERIATAGLLLSELPPGTPPRRRHFPRRNRLIAALALGTLVVEASLASGSLITARLAAECGAEVFAIPGSIMAPTKRGCHRLIRDGAKLVESSADVLEELAPALAAAGVALAAGLVPMPVPPDAMPPGAEWLLAALGDEPSSADQLAIRSGRDAASVLAALTVLELAGAVVALAGGRWQRWRGGSRRAAGFA